MADEKVEKARAGKLAAAAQAASLVEEGMVVGLGSGSTATLFIEKVGERVAQGMKIRAIASSIASEDLARRLNIPICDFAACPEIDLAVDGADEIGPGLALIKGGGGALLREKIVASAARRMVIVADSTKVVAKLGHFPLPIEVIPMAAALVAPKLSKLGIHPKVRLQADGSEFITDEGNLILDCACGVIEDPERLAASVRGIVGVVEHGLFLRMASMALVADGASVKELHA